MAARMGPLVLPRTPYAVSSARICVNPNYVVVKSDVLDDTAVKNNVLDLRMFILN